MTAFLILLLIVAVIVLLSEIRSLHERLASLESRFERLSKSRERSAPAQAQATEVATPARGNRAEEGPEEERPAEEDPGEESPYEDDPVMEGHPDEDDPAWEAPVPEESAALPTAAQLASAQATPRPLPPGVEREREPSAPAPPSGESAPFEWERWIGIRGAAVVGSVALILAGLFFVQVAIERGWLGPAARDSLALGVGAIALLAHGPLRVRGLVPLADSLAGAGTVLMYGGAWAAARLHDLVPAEISLAVMAGTTGTALWLAARHRAPILAGFALAGGFLTPILLETLDRASTGMLFGYLLVLNVALMVVARKARWWPIFPFALFGTLLLQVLWGEAQFSDPSPTWLVATLLSATTIFFTWELRSSRLAGAVKDPNADGTEILLIVALGAPFLLFARHGFSNLSTDPSLWIVAAFGAVMCAASALASRRFHSGLFLGGTSAATALLLGLFHLLKHGAGLISGDNALVFREWAFSTSALVVVIGVLGAWTEARRARAGVYFFALISTVASMVVIGGVHQDAFHGISPLYYAISALLVLAGCYGATLGPRTQFAQALLGGTAALSLWLHAMLLEQRGPGNSDVLIESAGIFAIATAALGAAALILSRFDRTRVYASSLSMTAAWIGLPGILIPLLELRPKSPLDTVDQALLYGAAAAVAAAFALSFTVRPLRSGVGSGLRHIAMILAGAASIPLFFAVAETGAARMSAFDFPVASPQRYLAIPVLLFVLPAAAAIRVRRARPNVTAAFRIMAWLAAGTVLIAIPLGAALVGFTGWLPNVQSKHAAALLLLPLGAIAASIGLIPRARDAFSSIAFITAGAALVANALARSVSAHEVIATTSLALGACALLALRAQLWTLVRVVAAAALIPSMSLLSQTFLFRGFVAEAALVPTQLSIDFGLTVFGAIACAFALLAAPRDGFLEVEELSTSLKIASVGAVLALLFGWMNAAVLNRFAEPGSPLELSPERLQARDLTLSCAWAVFAVVLLLVGMARRSSGLRWASLWLFLAVILKVFLYDLSALTGLSRVASFGGLAVALLLVSLLYSKILGPRSLDEPSASAT